MSGISLRSGQRLAIDPRGLRDPADHRHCERPINTTSLTIQPRTA